MNRPALGRAADGHTRDVVVEPTARLLPTGPRPGAELEPLSSLLARRHADIEVAARSLTDYDTAATTPSVTTRRERPDEQPDHRPDP